MSSKEGFTVRFFPKKTLAVLTVAASIGLASLGIERHGHEAIKSYYASNNYGVFALPSGALMGAEEGGFEVISRSGDSYRFAGTFHGIKEEKDFTAIGTIREDKCLVTILQNGMVTIEDDYFSPYFVMTADEKAITYYTRNYDRILFKEYARDTQNVTVKEVSQLPEPYWDHLFSCRT